MRITERQYQRMQAHRSIDGLAIQEHVRRALDLYLDVLDRKRERELVEPPKKPALQVGSPPAAHANAKLQYR
jgi:hypothetical protein